MATRIITITDDMIQSAVDFLGDSGNTSGRRQFAQSLYNEGGLRLQLKGEAHYVSSSEEDEEKVAAAKAEWQAEEQANRAKYPNLTDEEYKAQVKADKKAARIKDFVDNGMDQAAATAMVEEEMKVEEEQDANAAAQPDFDEEDYFFRKWIMTNNKDINKEVFRLISGGNKLIIGYIFDPNVLGVTGNENIGTVGEFAEGESITVDMLKTNFNAYLGTTTFTNGLAFVSRIAGVTFDVKTA